jgi:magnesium transporter
MHVRFLSTEVMDYTVDDIPSLLERTDGIVWVDVPTVDDEAAELLTKHFHLHPMALDACRTRNHVPSVHAYDEHMFMVMFAPLLGDLGKVHLLELDLVIGRNYLVTVHGPYSSSIDPGEGRKETDSMLRRLKDGRAKASSPARLTYVLGSGMARRQRALVSQVADRLPGLEEEVMASKLKDPEALLEQMFLMRHELITARTMAAQTHDLFARVLNLERWVVEKDRVYVRDLADQFDRVRSVADGEAQFLFGVIELYQTKVHTKMTVAMERLAVIAAVTLPIAAIASVFGMQFIAYNEETLWPHLVIVLIVMGGLSGALLRWAHKQGWW